MIDNTVSVMLSCYHAIVTIPIVIAIHNSCKLPENLIIDAIVIMIIAVAIHILKLFEDLINHTIIIAPNTITTVVNILNSLEV